MKYLLLVLTFLATARAEVIMETDFENESAVAAEWEAQGTDPSMAIISSDKAASGKRSLAIIDKDPTKYGAWQSKVIELPQEAIDKGQVSISWKILHSVPDGQVMRFSIFFADVEKDSKNVKHFNLKGESEGWSSGTFTEQRHDFPIPADSTKIRIKIASNASKGADGEVYLDDLKIEY